MLDLRMKTLTSGYRISNQEAEVSRKLHVGNALIISQWTSSFPFLDFIHVDKLRFFRFSIKDFCDDLVTIIFQN